MPHSCECMLTVNQVDSRGAWVKEGSPGVCGCYVSLLDDTAFYLDVGGLGATSVLHAVTNSYFRLCALDAWLISPCSLASKGRAIKRSIYSGKKSTLLVSSTI